MKQVAGRLRIDLAQYRELVAFTQFGTELDKATQAQLTRGAHMVEILKQAQYSPLPMAKQVMIIYAGTNGYLDDLPLPSVLKFEAEFYAYADKECPELEKEIETKAAIDDAIKAQLDSVLTAFKKSFKETHKI
jgi:F-type H+-transporting ATPase subunit alpha